MDWNNLRGLGTGPGKRRNWRAQLWRYGLAVVFTAGALGARMALDPILHNNYAFPTFFLAVILVNWLCGLGPTILTLVLGLELSDWFFIPPRHKLFVWEADQGIGIATYVVVSLVLAWSGSALRRARDVAVGENERRREAEAAARESLRRLEMVVAGTFEGVAISEKAHFIEVNEQFAAMLGYRREELLGKPVGEVIAPEDRPEVLEGIQAGVELRTETTMVRKDGTSFLAEAHGKTAEFGARQVRFTALRDITERKRIENALRQARDDLASYNARLEETVQERTARLQETVAELHHFSYALAHDMRAPLRATDGYLTIIERQSGAALTPGSRELFGRVRLAAQHLDHLITDALSYSRAVLEQPPRERVDLQKLLSGLVDTYPNLQSTKAAIQIGPGLPVVVGNRAALIQCFANLLDNGVKFSRPGTQAHVRVWAEERAAEAGGGNRVRIWVEDDGIGIAKESQARLFGMFQRLTPDYEGTGIGLAIVRKVVERMAGQVGVESEAGRGSRFWVELSEA